MPLPRSGSNIASDEAREVFASRGSANETAPNGRLHGHGSRDGPHAVPVRQVRVDVVATGLTVAALAVAYFVLDQEASDPQGLAIVLGVAAAGGAVIAVLPWERLFESGDASARAEGRELHADARNLRDRHRRRGAVPRRADPVRAPEQARGGLPRQRRHPEGRRLVRRQGPRRHRVGRGRRTRASAPPEREPTTTEGGPGGERRPGLLARAEGPIVTPSRRARPPASRTRSTSRRSS
jgi:hypothetical protein